MALKPNGYLSRIVDNRIAEDLEIYGALSIEGPKNCGKTWAARNVSNSEFQLNSRNRDLARTDISLALKGDEPHLIDEWQEVPDIWDEVRFEVDRSSKKGRFILCASSTLKVGSRMHSGSGRIGTIRMRPMTLFESSDSTGEVSLSGMFKGNFPTVGPKEMELERLIGLTMRGGWPDQIDMDPEKARRRNTDYISRICDEDIVRIDGVRRDSRKMRMLIRSIARNESTVASDNSIVRDMEEYDNENISVPTFRDYIGILERLNLLSPQDAFSTNVRSSVNVGKSPKRHLVDPSLSMAALGMDMDACKSDLKTFGFMFEAMCERDLDVYSSNIDGELRHYRDNRGNEIDAIVKIGNKWGAFEIKLGVSQIDSAARNLLKIKGLFEESEKTVPPEFLCVICGMSSSAYMRPDGVYVVPITMLGP